MELSELVKQYREGGAYQRNKLISKTLTGFKFKLLRRMVKRAYLHYAYFSSIAFHDHRDSAYFKKLLGWAIVERSGVLDEERRAALERHRRTHLEKGPDKNADPDTSILDLGIKADKEDSMKTKKKNKVSVTNTEKIKKKTVTSKPGGRKFSADAKITVLAKGNPKRPKTAAFARFELYDKSKTVGDFLAAGGLPADLSWDTRHKFISIDNSSGGSRKIKTTKVKKTTESTEEVKPSETVDQ